MSQLRSFKFYSNVAPVEISAITSPGNTQGNNLVNLDGYAAAAGWFQLFDSAVTPPGGTVPLKSINIGGAGNLQSLLTELGPIRFVNGIWAAMSSTEATYTAVGTNFDVWGELEEWEYVRDGVLVAGDYVTNLATLQVWGDGAGPKRLMRLQVAEKNGVASFIQLFFVNIPVLNQVPDMQIPLAANASVDLHFDFSPFRKDTSIVSGSVAGVSNDFNTHVGLTVAISETSGKYDTAGLATVRAEYYNSGTYP